MKEILEEIDKQIAEQDRLKNIASEKNDYLLAIDYINVKTGLLLAKQIVIQNWK